MTLPNRVTADGRIIADPARGTLTGNRGILHVADRQMGPALWRHRAWVCCELRHKAMHHVPMTGRHWTALFFLDEAVALAAGHRPCGFCRRPDFDRFRAAWGGDPTAPQMDEALHRARTLPGARAMRRHSADAAALPDHAFILFDDRPHLLRGDLAHPCTPAGYLPPVARPMGQVTLLTPPPTVAVLAMGYIPRLHPSLHA